MTRNRIILFLIVVSSIAAIYYFGRSTDAPSLEAVINKPNPQTINVDKLQINGQKVLGLPPGHEKEAIKDIKVLNSPSPEWKPNLEKAILAQGGNAVKDIQIDKVDSFVWSQDGVSLFVESVIVKIKNEDNESTSFRVLVDAQTGKILKNWDQPVMDPVNPRENSFIRIDSDLKAE